MDEEVSTITYEGFTLPYRVYGEGEDLLLAFHGYGRSAEDFAVFGQDLGKLYTIIAFDFFFHGTNSVADANELPPFTPGHLSNIIEKLLWEKKKIRCSVLGYSLGGKLVIGCLHHLPHRIHEVFLAAPDGFNSNPAQRFVTKTIIGEMIGNLSLNHPGFIIWLIRISKMLGFINEKNKQFMLQNIKTREDRLKVLKTWKLLKDYKPKFGLTLHFLRTRPIRFEIIYGKYDNIISQNSANWFLRKIKGRGRRHVLDSGHQLLKRHEEISRIILKNRINE